MLFRSIKNETLEEQIYNVSLFSKNKVIFVSEISDKIKKKIIEITENPQNNTKIFLFAQNLERKSSLRSHFEKNKNTSIIPCYQDNHRTLTEYLRKRLDGFTGINQEIIKDRTEYKIAAVGEITSTLLSTSKTPAL